MDWGAIFTKGITFSGALSLIFLGWKLRGKLQAQKESQETIEDEKELTEYNARKDGREAELKKKLENISSAPVTAAKLSSVLSTYSSESAKADKTNPGNG